MLFHKAAFLSEYRNLLDMVNNVVNLLWKSFSQNPSSLAAAAEVNASGNLSELGLSWVSSHAPCFYLNSKQVSILTEPQKYYKLLLKQIEKAERRIVLASLYLGNGSLEENLVLALKKRLEKKPNLRVKILLDCMRGSRGEINSRKMLIPLLKDFENSCQVSLYQTPLRGSFLSFIPEKYREIFGLQHIKVYLFDDNFIITGANLSNDYFNKRQDRYIFLSNCKDLSDFIEGLIDKLSDFSFLLNKEDKLNLSTSWPHNPLESDPKAFNLAASTHIKNYYCEFLGNSDSDDTSDTVVFPLLEMGPLGIHVDSTVTVKILEKCSHEDFVYLTTGYFNLTESYKNTMIGRSKAQFRILMAHPMANSFYKAKGPAGGIPSAYTSIALKFLDRIIKSGQTSRIRMLEYFRVGWTYHAKGLWLSSSKTQPPFLTMIGSPNFGERSVNRDLECQFLLATSNKQLQNELLRERTLMCESCHPFTKAVEEHPERKTPFWVKVVVWLFRTYL